MKYLDRVLQKHAQLQTQDYVVVVVVKPLTPLLVMVYHFTVRTLFEKSGIIWKTEKDVLKGLPEQQQQQQKTAA